VHVDQLLLADFELRHKVVVAVLRSRAARGAAA
jgi:hypothetical protein